MKIATSTILPKFIILSLSILILITISCNTESKVEKYKYIKGLSKYMNDVHQIDISNIQEKLFYILPISNCSTCQGTLSNLKALSALTTSNDKLIIIQVGQTEDLKYKALLNKIESSLTILKDHERTINNYQTGLSKPMLAHIKEGKIEYHLQITDFKIEEAGKYILSKS